MTAYAGHGIVSYSGRMAPAAMGRREPLRLSRHILPPSPLGPERAPALASPGARMSALDLFLPLAKVDLDLRLISGVATAETPDNQRIGFLRLAACTDSQGV